MKTKKIIVVFSLFCLIFFLSEKKVWGDYASSYQTYVNSTGTYQTAHDNYLTARATYLASGSLESQKKAQDATLAMLQSRDNVLVNYLSAINSKFQSTQGILPADQNSWSGQINTEISWYNAHNTKLSSAGSLDDLVNDSNDAKNQFQNSTLNIVYQSLITLGEANNSYIRGEINGEINTLEAKIAEIKANQDKDTSSIERSLIDVQNKISRSQDKDNAAKDLINALKPGNNGYNNFLTAQGYLTDSNSYLKEANQGLLQIITQIKTTN